MIRDTCCNAASRGIDVDAAGWSSGDNPIDLAISVICFILSGSWRISSIRLLRLSKFFTQLLQKILCFRGTQHRFQQFHCPIRRTCFYILQSFCYCYPSVGLQRIHQRRTFRLSGDRLKIRFTVTLFIQRSCLPSTYTIL